MCYFITLIVPTEDAEGVRTLMETHNRAARPVDNPSIRMKLRDGERQFLTTPGYCDCGTALAPRRDTPETYEKKLVEEVARLTKKGWSKAKIERAITGKRKANAKPSKTAPSDSIELWNTVLQRLQADLNLPYAGLLIRMYSGSTATEEFIVSRRQLAASVDRQVELASLKHDEVTIFQFN